MTNKENAMLCDREIWLPIEGYEGRYEVSNFGNVKALNYNRTGNEKVLQPAVNNRGYWHVGLWKNGKRKPFRVHRIVAETFLPNPFNLPEVNHKDEDKTNNRVDNLEWCSRTYNNNYGSHNEKVAKALSKKVLQYDLEGNLVKEWISASEVKRQLDYNFQHISACCRGEIKTAYGYIWKYNI